LFGTSAELSPERALRKVGKWTWPSRTLFLDDRRIALAIQAKLLRVLETAVFFERVGGTQLNRSGCAHRGGHQSRPAEADAREIVREDLYFRISLSRLRFPALRDRGNDVHLLAEYFPISLAAKFASWLELSSDAKQRPARISRPGKRPRA